MMNQDEDIYRKHSQELVRFATGLVGPFDAQDVVTDACLRAFQSRSWPEVTNRRAYLYRSVLNQAHSHHRSTLRRRIREHSAAGPGRVEQSPVDLDVLRAVDKLSMQQRACVFLTYWDDLAPAQVAARLGISEGSVKRHLARARARLKELLHD
ncbi:MAG: RNA polymerase sigma factor [Acidimicrobiia bacterium]|nr:RNA polymerase sigma factor [Acidimicrobiia bacterium]MBT8217925.1 RNA polymerase sigma factor [Acidimicrobiia bacterium]NNF10033.1 RNA polymerase sigma factor [Acidimicrobiia bacterium]